MTGLSDVYGAFCKSKCARYFRQYRHTMNSVEKANPSAEKDFSDWLNDQEIIMPERTWNDGYDEDGMPLWLVDFGYKYIQECLCLDF